MTMKEQGGGEWNVAKEKLLCHMVLNDTLAKLLSPTAGDAFWRAFILEDRETHLVSARFRWRYEDDRRSWYSILPQQEPATERQLLVETLRCSLEDMLKNVIGKRFPDALVVPDEEVMRCFYPPDDGGDGMKTVLWLAEKDLIEVKVIDVNPEGEQA